MKRKRITSIRSSLAWLVAACLVPAMVMAALLLAYDYRRQRAALDAALSPSRLEVIDESAAHAGHAGADGLGYGTHFRVRIASAAFAGKSRVAQHRLGVEEAGALRQQRPRHPRLVPDRPVRRRAARRDFRRLRGAFAERAAFAAAELGEAAAHQRQHLLEMLVAQPGEPAVDQRPDPRVVQQHQRVAVQEAFEPRRRRGWVGGAGQLVLQRNALREGIEAKVAEASREVEQERNRLAALMAELSQSVVVCNLDGRVLLFNARARLQFRALADGPAVGGAVLSGRVFDRIEGHTNAAVADGVSPSATHSCR